MYLLNINMKLDLTKQYIDLETVNKFIEYNSDFSDVRPIPNPHLDVVFMSYNEKDADKHYKLLKKRVPNAKRVNGVKGILNAYNACREITETPYYFIVEGDSMVCKDFNFKPPQKWTKHLTTLTNDEISYEYVKRKHNINWNSLNPVNGEILNHSPVALVCKSTNNYNLFEKFKLPNNYDIDNTYEIFDETIIEEDYWKMWGSWQENNIASISFFNTSPYDSWKTGFRIGNRLTYKLLNETNKQNHNDYTIRLDKWSSVGYEQKNGKYCIEGVTYGIKCAKICNNWIEEYRNTSDNYDWLRETFEKEYGTQHNTN